MDRHSIAAISVIGITLDLLGGMYLAYDLLGGKHGPLRTLTRVVTYGLFFGLCLGLPLGLPFGIAGGVALGATLGHEFVRASEGKLPAPWRYIVVWSVLRGVGLGIGAAFALGSEFGVWFGLLSGLGQMFAYKLGFVPTAGLQPETRPRNIKWHLLGGLNRAIGYGIGGMVSGLLTQQGALEGLKFGLKVGLVFGVASVILATLIPYIELKVDRLPVRLLGAIGAGLVVLGFVLQSVQYWVTLLDVPIK